MSPKGSCLSIVTCKTPKALWWHKAEACQMSATSST